MATVCRQEVNENLMDANKKQFFTGAKAVLQIREEIINKYVKRAVLQALFEEDLRVYLKKKYEWSESVWNTIDWESMAAPLDKLKGARRITVYKLIHF